MCAMADDRALDDEFEIPGYSKAETIMVTPPTEEGSLDRRKRRVNEGGRAATPSIPIPPPALQDPAE